MFFHANQVHILQSCIVQPFGFMSKKKIITMIAFYFIEKFDRAQTMISGDPKEMF